jgi:hypothetical protein
MPHHDNVRVEQDCLGEVAVKASSNCLKVLSEVMEVGDHAQLSLKNSLHLLGPAGVRLTSHGAGVTQDGNRQRMRCRGIAFGQRCGPAARSVQFQGVFCVQHVWPPRVA